MYVCIRGTCFGNIYIYNTHLYINTHYICIYDTFATATPTNLIRTPPLFLYPKMERFILRNLVDFKSCLETSQVPRYLAIGPHLRC